MNNIKPDLSILFADCRPIRYKRREIILRPEDIPSGVFFLKKGFVRLYTVSDTGEELTLIIFKPGDFFPIMWAIRNTPNTHYLETMTEVEVQRVPRDAFLEFLRNHPEIDLEVLTSVLTRLGGLLERMEYLVFGNANQKVASMLVICGERFGEKQGEEVLIKVPLTHKDIANLIGLTRETTSVEVKKLEREGIISRQGKYILIKSMRKLRKVANWEEMGL